MTITPEHARQLVLKHRRVLNKLEPHLGCVKCRGRLVDGRCKKCDPTPPTSPETA